MLGKGGAYVSKGIDGRYIGVDYDIPRDLTGLLPDQWREFNKKFIPIWLEKYPEKSKIAAGLAVACCGLFQKVLLSAI